MTTNIYREFQLKTSSLLDPLISELEDQLSLLKNAKRELKGEKRRGRKPINLMAQVESHSHEMVSK